MHREFHDGIFCNMNQEFTFLLEEFFEKRLRAFSSHQAAQFCRATLLVQLFLGYSQTTILFFLQSYFCYRVNFSHQ